MTKKIMYNKLWLCNVFALLYLVGCNGPATKDNHKLFVLVPPEHSGVHFSNNIVETIKENAFSYQYAYNGGGVAIGDINNDGLEDLYFSGNMVDNRLYLNKGNMVFEDITEIAGVQGRASDWATGAVMADVNGDGWMDIYVCYSGNKPSEERKNQLFINQGKDQDGNITFKDLTEQYGLSESSYTSSAYFFDYDNDGDLDLFLLNHNPAPYQNVNYEKIKSILQTHEPEMQVKLFKNENGRFTDVSEVAGLPKSGFSYGLGAGIADINKDGWLDIFIANDYSAPDHLFINNGDGTFTDKIKESFNHTSLYSMGADVADINNDGEIDIVVVDMMPESNERKKVIEMPNNFEYFNMVVDAGFHHQYMRNMLHLNNGNGTFSEIGQLAGVSNTDWSWAPLVADFDNDGWKDLFITNGYLRDFINLDFLKFKSSTFHTKKDQDKMQELFEIIQRIPASKESNFIYKNNRDLTFTNKKAEWGFELLSTSNGAAYADLDNDGDLDLIINNLNGKAFIYENKTNEKLKNNYLKVRLHGEKLNNYGIGAKLFLYANDGFQYQENMPYKGFQSNVSPIVHFGLENNSNIDSLKVVWPNGRFTTVYNIQPNQTLALYQKDAINDFKPTKPHDPLFYEVKSPINFKHDKFLLNDYKRQPLLVNPLSFFGPCIAKGDVNGDGLEDIFVGGGVNQAAKLFLQKSSGEFSESNINSELFTADKIHEDVDAVFFDANNDGLLDLYVCSGGYDFFTVNDSRLQDRLYLNNGKGEFKKADLPKMYTSSSCVKIADINKDGYNDIFVGGRVIPGRYPEAPESYILINDGKGRFSNESEKYLGSYRQMGMVTDAAFVDLDGDNIEELIIIGEWMPITILKKTNRSFVDNTKSFLDKSYHGWWNKLLVEDLNNDGKPDLIIGNLGRNSQIKASDKEPAQLYYKDFDQNGAIDPILCHYTLGESYPFVLRDELLEQISMMRGIFPDYASYSKAKIRDLFPENSLKNAGMLTANKLETIYLEGSSRNKFVEKNLPVEAQFSPVLTISSFDYNGDGFKDLLLCGNINQANLRFGKYDANYGVLLENDGEGNFKYIPQGTSGFQLKGDVRSVVQLNDLLLFGINLDQLKAYKLNQK